MNDKCHRVHGKQIELKNIGNMYAVIVSSINETTPLFSAVYFKYSDANKAYRKAYKLIVTDDDLDNIY